ncbi:hypothetical protein HDU67_005649, partial [Dinochytrium kinnereticum]
MSAIALTEVYDPSTALYPNPFLINGRPVRGRPFALIPFSDLPPLVQSNNNSTTTPGSNSSSPQTPGYGCFVQPFAPLGFPLAVNQSINCDPGFWCPYVDPTVPARQMVACPPSETCGSRRLLGAMCLGYQCATGTVTPIACQFLSRCPEGTIIESHIGLLGLVIVLDLLLFALVIGKRVKELKRASLPLSSLIPAPLHRFLLPQKKTRGRGPNTPSRDKKPATDVEDGTVVVVEDESDALGGATSSSSADPRTEMGAMARDDEVLKPLMACFRKAFDGQEGLKMDFKFDGLSLRLPNGKTILKGVTGEIRAGRMTAIMGPSGAGKTTFMNVLMGKLNRTGGQLEINGSVSEIHKFKKIIGYVPQEDTMLRELTCKEVVMHSARCRLPRRWSLGEVEECCDAVLEALGLSHVAHTQIGDEFSRGVSGGQRKRVNIAMELASTPLAMFLDEPTSGLDATSALDVSQILRSISRLGLTIISVIHQPRVEIFRSFDDVLLIAPGGKTAYLGPVDQVQGYFEDLLKVKFDPESNPADLLMDVLSGRGVLSTEEIVGAWEKRIGKTDHPFDTMLSPLPGAKQEAEEEDAVTDGSSKSPPTPTPSSTPSTLHTPSQPLTPLLSITQNRTASFTLQTLISFTRSLTQQSRFISALFLELFVATFAGFLMGFATASADEPFHGVMRGRYARLSSTPNEWFVGLYGMLVGIAIALAGAPAGVKVFGEERAVYWREVAAGHNAFAYYLGKTLSVVPRLALSSAHFTAVYYLLARPVFPVGVHGVAVIVSMLVRRENASLLAVIIGLFSSVFCGFGPSLREATEKGYVFAYNVGTNRWAAEVQYTLSLERYNDIYDIDLSASIFGYQRGFTVRNLLVMAAVGVAYRVVGFLLMVLLNRDK